MVENKIIKVSTRAKVNNVKELLIGALLGEVEDANNTANNANTNKVIAVKGPKREICILPVLIVVIDTSKFIVNRGI